MGLYLCVFEDDTELDGVEVGSYEDFAFFRSTVSELLERNRTGLRFPILGLHSDCDGEWSLEECAKLKLELHTIFNELNQLPPVEFPSLWQRDAAEAFGLRPSTLAECFIDVDGEPLIHRLQALCDRAIDSGNPILFQ